MRSISSPFVPVGFVPQPNQHYILPSLQAYTSALHSLGEILISIPQATFIPFSPKLFSNAIPMVYFISCGVFAPIKNYKSIAIKNKESIIRFPPKKNEYTKIAVPLTGSKGQALRVLGTISTPRYASGSILPKNLDSRRSMAVWRVYPFFSSFLFSFSFLGVKIICRG